MKQIDHDLAIKINDLEATLNQSWIKVGIITRLFTVSFPEMADKTLDAVSFSTRHGSRHRHFCISNASTYNDKTFSSKSGFWPVLHEFHLLKTEP